MKQKTEIEIKKQLEDWACIYRMLPKEDKSIIYFWTVSKIQTLCWVLNIPESKYIIQDENETKN